MRADQPVVVGEWPGPGARSQEPGARSQEPGARSQEPPGARRGRDASRRTASCVSDNIRIRQPVLRRPECFWMAPGSWLLLLATHGSLPPSRRWLPVPRWFTIVPEIGAFAKGRASDVGDEERDPALTGSELGRIVRGVDPARRSWSRVGSCAGRSSMPAGCRSWSSGSPTGWSSPWDRRRPWRSSTGPSSGLEAGEPLPATLILLAEPEGRELDDRARGRRPPRLLAAAVPRPDRSRAGPAIRRREHRRRRAPRADPGDRPVGVRGGPLGPPGKDLFLLPPLDDRSVYVEFAAVYLGLQAFADHLIPRLLPGDPRLRRRRPRPGRGHRRRRPAGLDPPAGGGRAGESWNRSRRPSRSRPARSSRPSPARKPLRGRGTGS